MENSFEYITQNYGISICVYFTWTDYVYFFVGEFTALGVTTATPKRRLGCSGTAVVKGKRRDAEQGVDICDNEFRPQGSSVPTDGGRCLISHA